MFHFPRPAAPAAGCFALLVTHLYNMAMNDASGGRGTAAERAPQRADDVAADAEVVELPPFQPQAASQPVVNAVDYARPRSFDNSQHIVRRGKELIVPLSVRLPRLCVKTGQATESDGSPLTEVQKTFNWTPPLLILVFFIPYLGLLLLLILYFVMRKKVDVMYSVQRRFIIRRRKALAIGLSMFFLGLAATIAAGVYSDDLEDLTGWVVIAGIVTMLTGIILAATLYPVLKVAKVTDRDARLSGCGPEFLDQFAMDPMM